MKSLAQGICSPLNIVLSPFVQNFSCSEGFLCHCHAVKLQALISVLSRPQRGIEMGMVLVIVKLIITFSFSCRFFGQNLILELFNNQQKNALSAHMKCLLIPRSQSTLL